MRVFGLARESRPDEKTARPDGIELTRSAASSVLRVSGNRTSILCLLRDDVAVRGDQACFAGDEQLAP